MAEAKRYAANLAAAALTDITGGGIANADVGTYLLNICNRSNVPVTVRVAITGGAAPGLADYIEYDAAVQANVPLSRWPIPLSAGWKLFVYASAAGVSATLIGQKVI